MTKKKVKSYYVEYGETPEIAQAAWKEYKKNITHGAWEYFALRGKTEHIRRESLYMLVKTGVMLSTVYAGEEIHFLEFDDLISAHMTEQQIQDMYRYGTSLKIKELMGTEFDRRKIMSGLIN
jgi:hypothetical protein